MICHNDVIPITRLIYPPQKAARLISTLNRYIKLNFKTRSYTLINLMLENFQMFQGQRMEHFNKVECGQE
jgi:hypothetical protein